MGAKLHIGAIEVPGRVWIAPMTGISDLPFRQTAAGLGAAYVATEMVACAQFAQQRADVMIRRATAVGDGLPLMVVQLVGCEPGLDCRSGATGGSRRAPRSSTSISAVLPRKSPAACQGQP